MSKTSGKTKKKEQGENHPAQNAPQANQPQQTNQWERVPEPGERSDKESIGRPVQLDNEHREPNGRSQPGHGEHASPAHADKSRI